MRTVPLPADKRCNECGEVKLAHHFYAKADGGGKGRRLSSYCRTCENGFAKDRFRRTYRTDPEFRRREKERVRDWRRKERGSGQHEETRRWHAHAAKLHVEALYAAGWRRCDIAAAVGCAKASVSYWRTGRAVPTDAHLKRLRSLSEATTEGRIVPPKRSQRAPKEVA